jgi:hypothetical protein
MTLVLASYCISRRTLAILLQFDAQFKPLTQLYALRDRFNARDASLAALGTFRKANVEEWTLNGNVTKEVEFFEYRLSNTEVLQIKLPIEDDSVALHTNWTYADRPTFHDQPLQQTFEYNHRGRKVLLFGMNAMLARLSGESAAARESFDQSLDRLPLPTSIQDILEKPLAFRHHFIDLQGDDESTELLLGLLRKLDAVDDSVIEAWRANKLLREAEYVAINLRWLQLQKWPTAAEIEKLGTIEAREGNKVVFGDGDLTIELLSEQPYRLFIEESENIKYVVRKLSNGDLRIHFGVSLRQEGPRAGQINHSKGSVLFRANGEMEVRGVIDPYQVGRLAFPPELIRIRLKEAAEEAGASGTDGATHYLL